MTPAAARGVAFHGRECPGTSNSAVARMERRGGANDLQVPNAQSGKALNGEAHPGLRVRGRRIVRHSSALHPGYLLNEVTGTRPMTTRFAKPVRTDCKTDFALRPYFTGKK